MPTEPTFEERLAALEARPEPPTLAVLQRKLEARWQPDASVLLAAGSATLALLKDLVVGTADLSFVASTDSDTTVVQHGLSITPRGVLAISSSAPAFGNIPLCNTWDYDATTFKVNGESKNPFTGTVNIVWIAFG